MKRVQPQWIVLALLGLSSAGQAALPLKYSFAQLNSYWNTQVTAPDLAAYQALQAQKNDIDGNVSDSALGDTPPDDLFMPSHWDQVLGETDEDQTQRGRIVVFPVIPLSRASSGIMRRTAMLEGYLQKERLLSQNPTEAEAGELERRRNAANMELFLSRMMRFAGARTLANRCQHIMSAQILEQSLREREQQRGALPVPDGFEALASSWQTTAEAYDLGALKRLACTSRSVSSKAELIQRMKVAAARRLLSQGASEKLLHGYDTRQETLMTAQLSRYTTVENQVNSVDMMVAKLMKLRDQLVNVKSSFELVRDDTYGLKKAPQGVKSSLDQLGEINYIQLKADFSLTTDATSGSGASPRYRTTLKAIQQKYEDVVGDTAGLKAILKSYVDLHQKAPEELQANLLPCSALLEQFSSVENAVLSGNSSHASDVTLFRNGFSLCLSQAVAGFTAQQGNNQGQYAVDDALASLVAKLSNTLIEIKKRPN